ncbi:uncharacterized protein V6R79_018515 [Siganus canaliculatus]
MPSEELGSGLPSGFAYLPDVSVTCSTSDFVVRVKPSFYGLDADAEELTLGETCKSNGVLRPYGDLLFTYPLTACDGVRQSPDGYLVYKFVLHFEPKSFPTRRKQIDVDIECRYQRNYHVSQLTVKPTWHTAVVRKKLEGSPSDFRIQLMDDLWSGPPKSQVYQLGDIVHFQVSAPRLPTGAKLYIDTCYATLSKDSDSFLKYIIIDNLGCMVDSRRDPGASQFVSRTDRSLRFSLTAFQFTSDPDTEVSVHCKVFVTAEGPAPAHKSCTYSGDGWKALTGDNSICECCDSQCVTSKHRRAMMEGSTSSRSLLVSDQPDTAEEGFLPISPSSVSVGRGGEATISHSTTGLHHYDERWGDVDVITYGNNEDQDYREEEEELLEGEGSLILGVMSEPDSDEFSLMKTGLVEEELISENRDSDELGENGSGYLVQGDLSESKEVEEADSVQQVALLSQRDGEMLLSNIGQQKESQPPGSEGGEENWKYTGREEKGEVGITSPSSSEVEQGSDDDSGDDKEMTWYFRWR